MRDVHDIQWQAYVQLEDGSQRVIEQDALVSLLHKQPLENKDSCRKNTILCENSVE